MTTTNTRTKAKRRENVQDAITVLVALLFGLLCGIRIEKVYLHDHTPVKCNAEDEVSVELSQDSYDFPKGTRACVHIDYLEVQP